MKKYDPHWPFPQYDENGQQLLPPVWDDKAQKWRPFGWAPKRKDKCPADVEDALF